MIDLHEKSLFIQDSRYHGSKVNFKDGASGHLEFRPLAKNAGIFVRDLGG